MLAQELSELLSDAGFVGENQPSALLARLFCWKCRSELPLHFVEQVFEEVGLNLLQLNALHLCDDSARRIEERRISPQVTLMAGMPRRGTGTMRVHSQAFD